MVMCNCNSLMAWKDGNRDRQLRIPAKRRSPPFLCQRIGILIILETGRPSQLRKFQRWPTGFKRLDLR